MYTHIYTIICINTNLLCKVFKVSLNYYNVIKTIIFPLLFFHPFHVEILISCRPSVKNILHLGRNSQIFHFKFFKNL